MIKFGSRTDVLLPGDVVPQVRTGMRVKGGATVLAILPIAAKDDQKRAAAVVS